METVLMNARPQFSRNMTVVRATRWRRSTQSGSMVMGWRARTRRTRRQDRFATRPRRRVLRGAL